MQPFVVIGHGHVGVAEQKNVGALLARGVNQIHNCIFGVVKVAVSDKNLFTADFLYLNGRQFARKVAVAAHADNRFIGAGLLNVIELFGAVAAVDNRLCIGLGE